MKSSRLTPASSKTAVADSPSSSKKLPIYSFSRRPLSSSFLDFEGLEGEALMPFRAGPKAFLWMCSYYRLLGDHSPLFLGFAKSLFRQKKVPETPRNRLKPLRKGVCAAEKGISVALIFRGAISFQTLPPRTDPPHLEQNTHPAHTFSASGKT